MTSDENKNIVRRLFEEVWNDGNLAVLDEATLPIPGSDSSGTSLDSHDLDHARRDVALFRATYPHLRFTVERQWASGNTVVTAWTATSTDQQGAPGHYTCDPQARVSGVDVTRFPG